MCCKHPLALGGVDFCRSYCAVAWVCTAVCNHLPNCIAFGFQTALHLDCKPSPVYFQAPRRRSDGAAVVDMERYQVKLYTTPGGEKLIKRRGGTVEKQYRLNIGRLPVAYRHAISPLTDQRGSLVMHTHLYAVPIPLGGVSLTTTRKAQMLQSDRGSALTLSATTIVESGVLSVTAVLLTSQVRAGGSLLVRAGQCGDDIRRGA